MFNQKLKQEISALQAQLQALTAQESAVSRAMAMIRFDRDGKVVSANPLFLQTMGYKPDRAARQAAQPAVLSRLRQ